MSNARKIISHFYARAALVLAVWGLKRLLSRRERRGGGGGGGQPARRAEPAIKTCTIIDGKDYKPRNPYWVVQWLEYDPSASQQQPACPLLQQWLQRGGPAEAAALLEEGRGRELFGLDPQACYLNHGSYGATLRLASQLQQWYREQADRQPVLFMETTNMQHLVDAVYAVRAAAALVCSVCCCRAAAAACGGWRGCQGAAGAGVTGGGDGAASAGMPGPLDGRRAAALAPRRAQGRPAAAAVQQAGRQAAPRADLPPAPAPAARRCRASWASTTGTLRP
jgi:hypothetical protein